WKLDPVQMNRLPGGHSYHYQWMMAGLGLALQGHKNAVRSWAAGILVHHLFVRLVEGVVLYSPLEESSSTTHPQQSQATPVASNVSRTLPSQMAAIDTV